MGQFVQHRFTFFQRSAALFIGCSALLIIGLQPLLLGALVDNGMLSMAAVGIVAMGEIAALGIGVVLSNALLQISYYRLIAVVSALFCAALNVATASARGDIDFILLRSATGLAEGVLVWVTSSIIVRSLKADRLAAIYMLLQALTQAAMAGILSVFVLPRVGWPGGFVGLGIVSVLCAASAVLLPEGLIILRGGAAARIGRSLSTLQPPAVAFLHMSAMGALWAYLEQIAIGSGFSAAGAQHLISATLFMQFFGGIASVLLIRRVDPVFTLRLSGAVLVAIMCAIIFLPANQPFAFATVCAVFGVIWLILMPFHLALAFRADIRGLVALQIPAAQLLGSAFGPLLASAMVTGNAVDNVPLVSLGFALCAFVVMLPSPRPEVKRSW